MASRLDRRRLALVLDRLDSNFDGERLAAVVAAARIMGAAGVRWRDLVEGVERSDNKSDGEAHDPKRDAPESDHSQLARDLLKRGERYLTAWERQFLDGVQRLASLTEKQRDRLDQIRVKVYAMTGRPT